MKKLHFLLAVLTVGLTLLSCEKEPIESIAETPEASVAAAEEAGDLQNRDYGVTQYIYSYWYPNHWGGETRAGYNIWCLSWHAMTEFRNGVQGRGDLGSIEWHATHNGHYNWRCRLNLHNGKKLESRQYR